MHTIQRLLTIVKSGSIYTLLDRYNYLYFYILKAFYFTFILTFFSISCNNNDPSNQPFCTCQNCFCAISSISLQNKDILFLYLSVILVGLIYTFLVYPFIYQFYTRITALVESTFWNPVELPYSLH